MSKLVFNRYWICDKSGSGREKWHYFVGDFEGDHSYARSHIIETEETWAQWADSYTMEVELDVKPTMGFLVERLRDYTEFAKSYSKMADQIVELIEERIVS